MDKTNKLNQLFKELGELEEKEIFLIESNTIKELEAIRKKMDSIKRQINQLEQTFKMTHENEDYKILSREAIKSHTLKKLGHEGKVLERDSKIKFLNILNLYEWVAPKMPDKMTSDHLAATQIICEIALCSAALECADLPEIETRCKVDMNTIGEIDSYFEFQQELFLQDGKDRLTFEEMNHIDSLFNEIFSIVNEFLSLSRREKEDLTGIRKFIPIDERILHAVESLGGYQDLLSHFTLELVKINGPTLIFNCPFADGETTLFYNQETDEVQINDLHWKDLMI